MGRVQTKPWILLVSEAAEFHGSFSSPWASPDPEWEQHSYHNTEEEANEEADRQFGSSEIFATKVVEV